MALQFVDRRLPLEWLVCPAWHRAGSFICSHSDGDINGCLVKPTLASLCVIISLWASEGWRDVPAIWERLLSIIGKHNFFFLTNPTNFSLVGFASLGSLIQQNAEAVLLVHGKAAFPAPPQRCDRPHPPVSLPLGKVSADRVVTWGHTCAHLKQAISPSQSLLSASIGHC